MTLILDASAALRFVISSDEKASKIIYSADNIIVPVIFHSETGNAMINYVKFKQMTFENAYENLITCFSLVTTFIDMKFYSKEILEALMPGIQIAILVHIKIPNWPMGRKANT